MAKLCAKGKAAAKRSGKVTPGGKKNKKATGGMIGDGNKISQSRKKVSHMNNGGVAKGCGAVMENKRKTTAYA